MATVIKTNSVEKNAFDYARAYAKTQTSNETIIEELVSAYILIAKNLEISVFEFIQTIESAGDSTAQAIYLAGQLNSCRVKNALLGVIPTFSVPEFISREIGA